VRPTVSMDQAQWTAAHVEAFAFFGGVPARLVPEYVPRNIFDVLCPAPLCGQQRSLGALMLVNGWALPATAT
jgi:transposase